MGDGLKRAGRAALATQGVEFCKKQVWDGFHSYACPNRATCDGYCGRHHPENVKAKREAREARYEAKYRARKEWLAAQERVKRAREEIVTQALGVWADHDIVQELLAAEAALAALEKP